MLPPRARASLILSLQTDRLAKELWTPRWTQSHPSPHIGLCGLACAHMDSPLTAQCFAPPPALTKGWPYPHLIRKEEWWKPAYQEWQSSRHLDNTRESSGTTPTLDQDWHNWSTAANHFLAHMVKGRSKAVPKAAREDPAPAPPVGTSEAGIPPAQSPDPGPLSSSLPRSGRTRPGHHANCVRTARVQPLTVRGTPGSPALLRKIKQHNALQQIVDYWRKGRTPSTP